MNGVNYQEGFHDAHKRLVRAIRESRSVRGEYTMDGNFQDTDIGARELLRRTLEASRGCLDDSIYGRRLHHHDSLRDADGVDDSVGLRSSYDLKPKLRGARACLASTHRLSSAHGNLGTEFSSVEHDSTSDDEFPKGPEKIRRDCDGFGHGRASTKVLNDTSDDSDFDESLKRQLRQAIKNHASDAAASTTVTPSSSRFSSWRSSPDSLCKQNRIAISPMAWPTSHAPHSMPRDPTPSRSRRTATTYPLVPQSMSTPEESPSVQARKILSSWLTTQEKSAQIQRDVQGTSSWPCDERTGQPEIRTNSVSFSRLIGSEVGTGTERPPTGKTSFSSKCDDSTNRRTSGSGTVLRIGVASGTSCVSRPARTGLHCPSGDLGARGDTIHESGKQQSTVEPAGSDAADCRRQDTGELSLATKGHSLEENSLKQRKHVTHRKQPKRDKANNVPEARGNKESSTPNFSGGAKCRMLESKVDTSPSVTGRIDKISSTTRGRRKETALHTVLDIDNTDVSLIRQRVHQEKQEMIALARDRAQTLARKQRQSQATQRLFLCLQKVHERSEADTHGELCQHLKRLQDHAMSCHNEHQHLLGTRRLRRIFQIWQALAKATRLAAHRGFANRILKHWQAVTKTSKSEQHNSTSINSDAPTSEEPRFPDDDINTKTEDNNLCSGDEPGAVDGLTLQIEDLEACGAAQRHQLVEEHMTTQHLQCTLDADSEQPSQQTPDRVSADPKNNGQISTPHICGAKCTLDADSEQPSQQTPDRVSAHPQNNAQISTPQICGATDHVNEEIHINTITPENQDDPPNEGTPSCESEAESLNKMIVNTNNGGVLQMQELNTKVPEPKIQDYPCSPEDVGRSDSVAPAGSSSELPVGCESTTAPAYIYSYSSQSVCNSAVASFVQRLHDGKKEHIGNALSTNTVFRDPSTQEHGKSKSIIARTTDKKKFKNLGEAVDAWCVCMPYLASCSHLQLRIQCDST
eukprot:GHVQ01013402.1.p1 GENE.GHVQ01013402.1~~GHVQ01013402.1.p1  ORF type:complete len:976 (+),score=107.67 GHVQ01013402.1:233-3160(+)